MTKYLGNKHFDGSIGIGVVPSSDRLTVNGVLSIQKATAPVALDGYGKLYVQDDGNLYYKDGIGTETNLITAGGGITATEGADGYIAFFTGAESIAGDNDLFWDRPTNTLVTNTLHINNRITNPSAALNLGTTASTTHSLTSGSVLVGGQLEVDGIIWSDTAVVIRDSTSIIFGGTSGGVSAIRSRIDLEQLTIEIGTSHGKAIVLGDTNKDYGHAPVSDPTIFIHSDTDPAVDNTQWISISHNTSQGYINTGTNSLLLDGAVGIGTTPSSDRLTVNGVISIQEATAPDPLDGYGKLYVQADGYLYYKSGTGAETNLTGLILQDEGTSVAGTPHGTVNFVGDGVEVTGGGSGVATVTVANNGDVTGPASSVDNAIARFDGVSGKLIEDSLLYIDDSGNLNPSVDTAYNIGGASTKFWKIFGNNVVAMSGATSPTIAANKAGFVGGSISGAGASVTHGDPVSPYVSPHITIGHAVTDGTGAATITNEVPGGVVVGAVKSSENSTAYIRSGYFGWYNFTGGVAFAAGGGTSGIENYAPGSFAWGYMGAGVMKSDYSGRGCFMFGRSQGAGTHRIACYGSGSFVGGFQAGGNSSIIEATAGAGGAFCQGNTGGGGIIRVESGGSFAQGSAANTGATIISSGTGAFAQGSASDSGSVLATGEGSFAHGRAKTYDITASGISAFSVGYSSAGAITASATNSAQFGPGINSLADSLKIGNAGLRFKGTTGAPGTPVDGDFWVNSTIPYVRSESISVPLVDGVYGEIYCDENATPTTLTTQNQWYKATIFDTDGYARGATPDNTNDYITADRDGTYRAHFHVSAEFGTGSQDYEFMLRKNNGTFDLHNCHINIVPTFNGYEYPLSVSSVIRLSTNDTVELWVRCTTSASVSVTLVHAVLNIERIGE